MRLSQKSGFTLLEIIIVIIIIAILASVGLPKFTQMTNQAKANEGLMAIPAIKSSMEQCYLMSNNTYAGCTPDSALDDNFKYFNKDLDGAAISGQSTTAYTVTLTCPATKCGEDSTLVYAQTAANKTISGTGAFAKVKVN